MVEPMFTQRNTCTILRNNKIINSHIDWVFSGIPQSPLTKYFKIEAYPYESWFSDHKPLYIKIKCSRKLPNNIL